MEPEPTPSQCARAGQVGIVGGRVDEGHEESHQFLELGGVVHQGRLDEVVEGVQVVIGRVVDCLLVPVT